MKIRVAFVGIKRSPSDMPKGYWSTFVRYHLELPWYYASGADMDVDIVHPEPIDYHERFDSGGSIRCITEEQYLGGFGSYDIVVHWRKWFDYLYDPNTRNVVLSQDHSYGDEWKASVRDAFAANRLDGLLVFPTWHRENVATELKGIVTDSRLYEGMTLGVDTDVYRPGTKDPYSLLWASDPGRGLETLINPFIRLWQRDRRFHLTVTYPDYVRPESLVAFSGFFRHPGVRHVSGVRNGPALWDLFNSAGFLPYSSTFMEPSSRCHRQAMAAGCVVLYPPNAGSPSSLIESGLTGIVDPVHLWPDVICSLVSSGRREEVGFNARQFALSENWDVQARRFHDFVLKGRK